MFGRTKIQNHKTSEIVWPQLRLGCASRYCNSTSWKSIGITETLLHSTSWPIDLSGCQPWYIALSRTMYGSVMRCNLLFFKHVNMACINMAYTQLNRCILLICCHKFYMNDTKMQHFSLVVSFIPSALYAPGHGVCIRPNISLHWLVNVAHILCIVH